MTANGYTTSDGDVWCCEGCAEASHLAWCSGCDDEIGWHIGMGGYTYCEGCDGYH